MSIFLGLCLNTATSLTPVILKLKSVNDVKYATKEDENTIIPYFSKPMTLNTYGNVINGKTIATICIAESDTKFSNMVLPFLVFNLLTTLLIKSLQSIIRLF